MNGQGSCIKGEFSMNRECRAKPVTGVQQLCPMAVAYESPSESPARAGIECAFERFIGRVAVLAVMTASLRIHGGE